MPSEQALFHKGLAFNVRSALQEPGFLQVAENIIFQTDGKQELRPKFDAINSTALNAIHSIKRFRDNILVGDATNLRSRSALSSGDFSSLGSSFANSIFSWLEYKEFLHGVNGTDNVLFDASGNLYPGRVAEPTTAATLADSGDGGDPDDDYIGYVSYLITWPGGETYETGLSPESSEVTVATNKISWSDIPISPYVAYTGTAPTIHRKLYRGPGAANTTLTDIYLVTTITDNTTTTYTDDESDSELATNGATGVDTYVQGPANALYTAVNYGRFFYIDANFLNRLYFTNTAAGANADENETLMPLSIVSTNWDDIRTAGYGKCDPQGLVTWGIYLYIPMKHTWIRKFGNDPITWSYKKTWANFGIAAPYSLTKCGNPHGILGISSPIGERPGLSLFNGQLSQMITGDQFNHIFEDDLNLSAIDKCRGSWDGRYYHLLYPSGSNTEPDKWLALDLGRFPEIRAGFWADLNAQAIEVYDQGSKVYVGGSDGIVRENGGSTTVNVDVRTHDMIGGDISAANTSKTLKELKYNLNTGGKDVDLQVWIDGAQMEWPDKTDTLAISGTRDAVQVKRGFPPNFEGYLFSFRVVGSAMTTFELFSPWEAVFDVTQ